jgi:hypothetical protein
LDFKVFKETKATKALRANKEPKEIRDQLVAKEIRGELALRAGRDSKDIRETLVRRERIPAHRVHKEIKDIRELEPKGTKEIRVLKGTKEFKV